MKENRYKLARMGNRTVVYLDKSLPDYVDIVFDGLYNGSIEDVKRFYKERDDFERCIHK